jgi:N6-adenosine-specific RNA methylase IME4
MSDPFEGLPRGHFGAILADPPWHWKSWGVPVWNGEYRKDGTKIKSPPREIDYPTMSMDEIANLEVGKLAAEDCILFIWSIWALLPQALEVTKRWGFIYKTCAFDWMKAHAGQLDMLREDGDVQMGMGYWTRANTEPCLLATRGKPKRLNADVRQGIIEPRREHSRKPDCVHERIERLVAGPYLELFARQRRPGWTCWGNETDKFTPAPEPSPDWHAMWARPFDYPERI